MSYAVWEQWTRMKRERKTLGGKKAKRTEGNSGCCHYCKSHRRLGHFHGRIRKKWGGLELKCCPGLFPHRIPLTSVGLCGIWTSTWFMPRLESRESRLVYTSAHMVSFIKVSFRCVSKHWLPQKCRRSQRPVMNYPKLNVPLRQSSKYSPKSRE